MGPRSPPPPRTPIETGRGLRLGVVLVMVLSSFLLIHGLMGGYGQRSIPYSEFESQIEGGKLKSVEIGDDWAKGYETNIFETSQSTGKTPVSLPSATPPFVQTQLVPGTAASLAQKLTAKGVPFNAVPPSKWGGSLFFWLMPLVLMFVFWSWALRRSGMSSGGPGGILSFGKMQARIVAQSETGIGFRDVAGVDEAVDELREIVEFLRAPEKFRALGARIPKGVLLVGPPGTGKTLLARAVAGEAHVPFFSLSGSQFVEMFVGVGAARVRDLFKQAQQVAPCIIFIDELDALGRSRGVGLMAHEEREQTLNQLLSEMDGFDARVGLIVLAATNRPEILDVALLRPGRFDRQVLVDRPDKTGRERILELHARRVRRAQDVNLREVAAETAGFAGADLENLVNEAALLAARRGKTEATHAEFDEAIERVTAGLEKKGRRLNAHERDIVAHHEAGHAVVGWLLPGAERVRKVSIVPRGVAALGYTRQQPLEDRYLADEPELQAKIAALLGGRVAEQLVFGVISTGSVSDLQRATEIARAMVRDYGMSQRLGPISLAGEHRQVLLAPEGTPADLSGISERTREALDDEVQRLLNAGEQTARRILSDHRDELERLARLLLQQEVIEEHEIAQVLGEKLDGHEGEHGTVYAPPAPGEATPPSA